MLILITFRLTLVATGYRFLPIIFIYFTLTTAIALIRIIRLSNVTPILLFLLLTRGIMVFMLFCALLFNSKIVFNSSDFVTFFRVPLLAILTINPIQITDLSYRFVSNPRLIFTLPSLMLVICSVRNLNVAQRT